MAQYPNVPQFNIADFLARRRQAKLKDQGAGLDYTDILRQESAANQGYTTSSSFAGPKEPSAIGQNYEAQAGTGNFANVAFGTFQDITQNVLYGAGSIIEGIVDYAVGLGGQAGLGNKTDIENFVKQRWSDDLAAGITNIVSTPLELAVQGPGYIGAIVNDISSGNFNLQEFIDGKYSSTKYSAINSNIPEQTSFVEDVAQGVGQLLPLIAITAATGGLGGGAVAAGGTTSVGGIALTAGAAKAIGITAISVGAAGGSFEQALKDDYDYGTALLYGTASGAVEAATEIVVGGLINKGVGAVTKNLTPAANRFLSSAIMRTIQAGTEEGLEEIAAEVGGTALDYFILQDEEAWSKRLTAENLSRTFFTTFVSSSIGNFAFQQPIVINGKKLSRSASEAFYQRAAFEQLNDAEIQAVGGKLSFAEREFNKALQPLVNQNALEADANGQYEAVVPGVGNVRFNIAADANFTPSQLSDFNKKYQKYQEYTKQIEAYDAKLDIVYKENNITQEDLDKENIKRAIPQALQEVEAELKNIQQKQGKYLTVDEQGNPIPSLQSKKSQAVFGKMTQLAMKRKSLLHERDMLEAKYKTFDDVLNDLNSNNWKDIMVNTANGKNEPLRIADYIGKKDALAEELLNLQKYYPMADNFISAKGYSGQTFVMLFDSQNKPLFYNERYFENKKPSLKQLEKNNQQSFEDLVTSAKVADKYVLENLNYVKDQLYSAIQQGQIDYLTVRQTGFAKNYAEAQVQEVNNLQNILLDIESLITGKQVKTLKDSKGNKINLKDGYFTDEKFKGSYFLSPLVDLKDFIEEFNQFKLIVLKEVGKDIKDLNQNDFQKFIDTLSPNVYNSTLFEVRFRFNKVVFSFGNNQETINNKEKLFTNNSKLVPLLNNGNSANNAFNFRTNITMTTLSDRYDFEKTKSTNDYFEQTSSFLQKINFDLPYDLVNPYTENGQKLIVPQSGKKQTPIEFSKDGNLILPNLLKAGFDFKQSVNKLNEAHLEVLKAKNQGFYYETIPVENVENLVDFGDLTKLGKIEDVVSKMTKQEIIDFFSYYGIEAKDLEKSSLILNEDGSFNGNFADNFVKNVSEIEQKIKNGQINSIPVIKIMYNENTGELALDKSSDKFLAMHLLMKKIYRRASRNKAFGNTYVVSIDTYSKDFPKDRLSELASEKRYIVNEYTSEKENNAKYIQTEKVEYNSNINEVFSRLFLGEIISTTPYPEFTDMYAKALAEKKARAFTPEEIKAKERSLFSVKERAFLRKLDNIETINSVTSVFETLKNDPRSSDVYGYDPYKNINVSPLDAANQTQFMFGMFKDIKDMMNVYANTPNKIILNDATEENLRKRILDTDGATIKNGQIVTYKAGYQVAFDKTTELIFESATVPDGSTPEAIAAAKAKNLDDAMAFLYGHSHTAKLLENVGFWFEGTKLYLDPSTLYVSDYAVATILQTVAEQNSIVVWKDGVPQRFLGLEFKTIGLSKQNQISNNLMVRQKNLPIEYNYGVSKSRIKRFKTFQDLQTNAPKTLGVDKEIAIVEEEGPNSGVYAMVTDPQNGNIELKKVSERIFLSEYFMPMRAFMQLTALINSGEMIGMSLTDNNFSFDIESNVYGQAFKATMSVLDFYKDEGERATFYNTNNIKAPQTYTANDYKVFFETQYSYFSAFADSGDKIVKSVLEDLEEHKKKINYDFNGATLGKGNFGLPMSDMNEIRAMNPQLASTTADIGEYNELLDRATTGNENLARIYKMFMGRSDYDVAKALSNTEVDLKNGILNYEEQDNLVREDFFKTYLNGKTIKTSWGETIDLSKPISPQTQKRIIDISNESLNLHTDLRTTIAETMDNNGKTDAEIIKELKKVTNMIVWVDVDKLQAIQEFRRSSVLEKDANGNIVLNKEFNDSRGTNMLGADYDRVHRLMESILTTEILDPKKFDKKLKEKIKNVYDTLSKIKNSGTYNNKPLTQKAVAEISSMERAVNYFINEMTDLEDPRTKSSLADSDARKNEQLLKNALSSFQTMASTSRIDFSSLINDLQDMISDVSANIKPGGLFEPMMLVYNDETGQIQLKDGNHRFNAFAALGMKKVPVILGVTKQQDLRTSTSNSNIFYEPEKFKSKPRNKNYVTSSLFEDLPHLKNALLFQHLAFVKPELQSIGQLDAYDAWSPQLYAFTGSAGWGNFGQTFLANMSKYLPNFFNSNNLPTYAPSLNSNFNYFATYKNNLKKQERLAEDRDEAAFEQQRLNVDQFLAKERDDENAIELKRQDFDLQSEVKRAKQVIESGADFNRDDLTKPKDGKKRFFILNPNITKDNFVVDNQKAIKKYESQEGYLLLEENDAYQLLNDKTDLHNYEFVVVDLDEAIFNGDRKYNSNLEPLSSVMKTASSINDFIKRENASNSNRKLILDETLQQKAYLYKGDIYLNEVSMVNKSFKKLKAASNLTTFISVSSLLGKTGLNYGQVFKTDKQTMLELGMDIQKIIKKAKGELLKEASIAKLIVENAIQNEDRIFERGIFNDYKLVKDVPGGEQLSTKDFVESLAKGVGFKTYSDGQRKILDFIQKTGAMIEKRKAEGVSYDAYLKNPLSVAEIKDVDLNKINAMKVLEQMMPIGSEFDTFLLAKGLLKWFKGANWSKELRLALNLYLQNQEPVAAEEKRLLDRFIYDFGLVEIENPLTHMGATFFKLKEEYYPTWLKSIKDVLVNTGAIGKIDYYYQAQASGFVLGGFLSPVMITNKNPNLEFSEQATTVVKNMFGGRSPADFKLAKDVYLKPNLSIVLNSKDTVTGVMIHELNHLLLRQEDPQAKAFEIGQQYIKKVINIVDYIRTLGESTYTDFIGLMFPSYESLYTTGNIRLKITSRQVLDKTTNQLTTAYFTSENSVEEEALAELVAYNLNEKSRKFIEKDPVLKRMIEEARDNVIALTILNKTKDSNIDETVSSVFKFDYTTNDVLSDILQEKIKTQPEPKEPKKFNRKAIEFGTKIQEAVQDAAAPMLRAFEYFGHHDVGDALLQQIRSATAKTEQYIIRGIYDTKTQQQLAKPLYSPNFSGEGIFDFLLKQEIGKDRKGRPILKEIYNDELTADFFLYNFLKHNEDSQNLTKKNYTLSKFNFGDETMFDKQIADTIKQYIYFKNNPTKIPGKNQVPARYNPVITQEEVDAMIADNVISKNQGEEMKNQLRYYITIFGKYVTVSKMSDKVLPVKLLEDTEAIAPELFKIIKAKGAVQANEIETWFMEAMLAYKGNRKANQAIKLRELRDQYRLFYQEVDMNTTKVLLEKMDKQYPIFKEKNQQLVKYMKVLFQQQLESGLISQERFDELNEKFPNYVPLSREYVTGSAAQGIIMRKLLQVRNPAALKRKGSDRVLEPLDISVARRVQLNNRAIAINNLMNQLFDYWETAGYPKDNPYIKDAEYIQEQRRTSIHQEIDEMVPEFAGETITFYRKGVKVIVTAGSGLARALQNLTTKSGAELGIIGEGLRFVGRGFRNLVTVFSPIFQAKNFARDQYNSMILSKNGLLAVQIYTPISISLLATGGQINKKVAPLISNEDAKEYNGYYLEFLQNGGVSSSLYSHDDGITPGTFFSHSRVNKTNKTFRFMRVATSKVTKVSSAIELVPRLSEYIASRKAGKSIVQSINDAANVTVNFSKAGTFGRLLNTFGFTFLNANIQGKANLARRLLSPGSMRAWVGVISKFVILGVAASIFNELLHGDDDEYIDLPDYVKEQNFLIKIGDKFLMIPKGQIFSEFAYFFNIAEKVEDPDFTIFEAFNVVDPFNGFRSVFSPFVDVATNTTWYGGEIVGARYDGVRPENQYSDATTNFAKWLGGILKVSPLKVDYLLNSYGGVFYDVFFSNNSIFESDTSIGFESFIADPVDSNRWSSEFYDLYTLMTWDRNDGDVIAGAQYSYMNRVRFNINEMYKEMELIKLSETLTKKEKEEEVRVIQSMINMAYKQAIDNTNALGDILQNYELSELSYEQDVLNAYKQLFGGEYALRTYNKDVHTKASYLNKLGVSFDDYFDYYFAMKLIDDDTLKYKYINKLNLPKQVKQVLFIQAGGSVAREQKESIKTVLRRYKLSEDEINWLLRINKQTEPTGLQSIYSLFNK